MRHLLGGVALAALLAAGLPAAAQTNGATQPNAQTGASTDDTGTMAKGKHAKHQATARQRASSDDNIAEQLNRQELQRITQNAAPASGSTTTGTGMTPRQ